MTIDFSIGHISREEGAHAHAYGQFVMPYSGSMHIAFEDQNYVIDDKSIAYIPPHVMHKYSSDHVIKALLVDVSMVLIKEHERKTLQIGRASCRERV